MPVQTLYLQVFVNNFVHADLHPGNIIVQYKGVDGAAPKETSCLISEEDDLDLSHVQLVFLDAGIISSLSDKDLDNLHKVFKAIVTNQVRISMLQELIQPKSCASCMKESKAFQSKKVCFHSSHTIKQVVERKVSKQIPVHIGNVQWQHYMVVSPLSDENVPESITEESVLSSLASFPRIKVQCEVKQQSQKLTRISWNDSMNVESSAVTIVYIPAKIVLTSLLTNLSLCNKCTLIYHDKSTGNL